MSKVINPDTGKPYLTEEECEAAKAEPLNFTDTSGDADNSEMCIRDSFTTCPGTPSTWART